MTPTRSPLSSPRTRSCSPANADRWRVTGTHKGEFLGMAPTGRSISVEGCTFSRFGEDGLVVRDVNFWDVPGLLAQLTG